MISLVSDKFKKVLTWKGNKKNHFQGKGQGITYGNPVAGHGLAFVSL